MNEARMGSEVLRWVRAFCITDSSLENRRDRRNRRYSRNADFLIRPIHFPQSIANLADGSVCPDAIDDVGHSVGFADAAVSRHNRLLGSRALEGVQPPVDFRVVAAGAPRLELGRLL